MSAPNCGTMVKGNWRSNLLKCLVDMGIYAVNVDCRRALAKVAIC